MGMAAMGYYHVGLMGSVTDPITFNPITTIIQNKAVASCY